MQDYDVGYAFSDKYASKSRLGFYFLGGILLIALLGFLFANDFLMVFLVDLLFAAANAGMRMYKAYVDFPLELEFTTFATVTMSMGFGFKAGLFTAVFVGFFGDVFTGVTAYTPITIGSYIFAALLASLFPADMFLLAGIIISLVISGLSWILYHITQSFSPFENVMYAATELAGNVYFFFALAWIARIVIGH